MNVEGILAGKSRDIVTINPGETVAEAVTALDRHRIGAVLVCENDRVVGILSERDIVRGLAERGTEILAQPLSELMTVKPKTCTPRASVDEVMEMMTNGKFRHVPVLDGERLVGIVSIGDVVKHRLAAIESEHAALRDYIATA